MKTEALTELVLEFQGLDIVLDILNRLQHVGVVGRPRLLNLETGITKATSQVANLFGDFQGPPTVVAGNIQYPHRSDNLHRVPQKSPPRLFQFDPLHEASHNYTHLHGMVT